MREGFKIVFPNLSKLYKETTTSKKLSSPREGIVARSTKYLKGVRTELKRVTWPSWSELKATTIVVTLMVVIVSFYMWLVDKIFYFIFKALQ